MTSCHRRRLRSLARTLVDPAAGRTTEQPLVDFSHLAKATPEQLSVQGRLFEEEKEQKQTGRVLDMVRALKGCHLGHKIDLYEHSVQSATLAYRDGADEETVVVALLHDIGELLCPNAHGELPASLLRPYISDENWWVLAHHEIFQFYHYGAAAGGDPLVRDRFKANPHYDACVRFCERYDAPAFKADYDSLPLEFFEPMVRRVLSRTPYSLPCHAGKHQINDAKILISAGYSNEGK